MPSSLFISGQSGGGVLTLWAVTHTHRFRAAVAIKPVVDWQSWVLQRRYRPVGRPALDGRREAVGRAREIPRPLAAHLRARTASAPTLLMAGETDSRTPMSETLQMYAALRLAGRGAAPAALPRHVAQLERDAALAVRRRGERHDRLVRAIPHPSPREMTTMRRRALLAATAAPLLGALPRPAIAQAGARTLRFVPQSDLSSIDPLWSVAVVSVTHGYMVWDTLFGIDLHLEPKPQMCEGAEASADGRTWTFKLRDGLLFHDGTKVLPADCIASLKRWMEKDPFGQTVASITTGMTPLDDQRFTIELSRPFRLLLFAIAIRNVFIMPERIARTPSSQQFKEVIGSGPYRFLPDEWQAGARVGYAKFDKYVPRQEPPNLFSGGKVANFDRVEWIVQPDPATATAALQRNEVDVVERPLLDLLPLLQRSSGMKIEELDTFGALAILRFNQLQPPFDNLKLRQALLPAIDQSEVVAAAVGDQTAYGTVPVGFFTAGSPMSNDAGMAALTSPRDPARARQLIAESGYKGERIVMPAPSDLPQIMAMSQVMQDQLKQVGLNIDFQVMDWGTMLSRIAKREPVDQGGWSCFCVTWAGLSVATPGSSYPLRGNGTSGWNGWPTDKAIEDLRQQWFDAPDMAAEQAICRQMQQEAFTTLPYIPLGQWTQPAAYRSTVSGLLPSPFMLFWNAKKAQA